MVKWLKKGVNGFNDFNELTDSKDLVAATHPKRHDFPSNRRKEDQ